MALGKMLNLGGMENSLPKTNQSVGRFRVARNVQPSVNGRIIPRSSYEVQESQPEGIRRYVHLKDYFSFLFKMGVNNSNGYEYFRNNTSIPRASLNLGGIVTNQYPRLSVMSWRKNNTIYLLNSSDSPVSSSFLKYDGVEMSGCGSPQPRFGCDQVVNTSTSKWIKVLQHRWDFDNIETISESVTFPIANATNSITIRTDSGASNIINSSNSLVDPQLLVTPNAFDTDDLFFVSIAGAVTYNPANRDYTVPYTESNITESHQVGCYVILCNNGITAAPTFWGTSSTGYTQNCRLIAMRVKSVSPTTNSFVLDARGVKRMFAGSAIWTDANLNNSTFAAQLSYGGRKIFSVWTSTSPEAGWVLRGINLAFPESTVSRTFGVDTTTMTSPVSILTAPTIPIIASPFDLSATYDVTSRKQCLNTTEFGFGPTGKLYGMTAYQDQLLWWDKDLIYFSDPTLGGTLEMTAEDQAVVRIGDSEFGDIVSCCGTPDFLVVSRERKNYYINGNLSTGNFRIQELGEIEIGAWCNNGTINIKDSVILINATSVWQIQGGSRVSELGSKISQNFSTFDGFGSSDDVAFKLNGTGTFPLVANDSDNGLDISFDEYREYLIFCQRASVNTPVLILHTKTGEFYEWSGLELIQLRSMHFFKGVLYYGTVLNGSEDAVVKSELSSSTTQDYAGLHPIKLYSTWLTSGEPSLEKQLLQLKMFGYVTPNADKSINVVHFKDWGLNKVTNSAYIPDSSTQFSHLKRLNSDKVLAASVGFEVVDNGVTFEVESFEVEFNPIQQGIKR